MPRSRFESSLVAAGVVLLVLLVWLGVGAWDRYERQSQPTAAATPRADPTTGAATATAAPAARTTGRAAALAHARLRLTAARGDCWIVLRARSATGKTLFAGTLAQSHSIAFAGRRFWISLGAAANVDATWAGTPLRDFPRGTVTVAVNGSSVRALG